MSFIINPYRFAAGSPFGPDPSTISNLELWLPADGITGLSDGDQIATVWPDSSGNARDATAVAGASGDKPTWHATLGPGSRPAVRFDHPSGITLNSGYFTLPNFMTGFTAGHVFVVMQKTEKSNLAAGRCSPPLGDWGSTTDDFFCFNTDSKIYDGTGSSARKTTVDPGDVTTNAFLYEVRTASGAWSNWKNGTSLFSTGTNTVAFGSAPFLGHTATNNKRYRGYASEYIFYSRVLSAGEITTIKTYITAKYGLTLA